MKVGVIRFPASNCDFDTIAFFKRHNHETEFVWYSSNKHKDYDLLVLPGGFAFADRVV